MFIGENRGASSHLARFQSLFLAVSYFRLLTFSEASFETILYHTTRLIIINVKDKHCPDDVFNWIIFNEIIKISLKFVPWGPLNDIPAMVQIMIWHRPADKSLSDPMMVSLLTHICVTRPQ